MKYYSEWKNKYKHTEYCLRPNKKKLKLNTLHFEDVDVEEFNKIYRYCKHYYVKVPCTRSKGLCNEAKWRFSERFTIIPGNQVFELIIICLEGCYRFVLKNRPSAENTIRGTQACREIYSKADEYNIDFSRYAQGSKGTKDSILSPHIEFLLPERFLGDVFEECNHLDLNSAYASMIVEQYPELKEMYDDLYSHRKDNDGYYKHVLTNSIGAWQSEYCVDYESRRNSKPYQFANLSKIAINGTRRCIEMMLTKLRAAGRMPILTNTDGIWYKGKPFHGKGEGNQLGQWKNDHVNCKLLVKSKGAYQYLENGKCHSVVRGTSNLDLLEDREDWEFGDIMAQDITVAKYKLTEEGVKKVWVSV